MKTLLSKNLGFCFGVKEAIKKTIEFSKKHESTYILGELIHNSHIVEELKKYNIFTLETPYEKLKSNIDDLIHSNKDFGLVFTAHGHEQKLEQYIKEKNIDYIDATCPYINKIHERFFKYNLNPTDVFYIGDKNHIESIINLKLLKFKNLTASKKYREINFANNEKITFINQSTYKIDGLKEYLLRVCPTLNFKIMDNFCPSVNNKYREVKLASLEQACDYIIVITDSKSSNGNQLFNYSIFCFGKDNVFKISDKNELQSIFPKLDKNKTVFVTSATSMDDKTINDILELLRNY